jgi:pilus assembly protein CpaE
MAVLRFAVFSESPEIYARVAQALGAIEGVEVAPLSARGSDLGAALARAELDGLYVDLGRQPEALLGALERAPAGRRPALLFGAVEPEVSLLVRALRLQPLDFLVNHDLTAVAERIAELASSAGRARAAAEPAPERFGVVAVSGAKGGVGTTLVCCELAAALARSGERVALLDMNLRFGDAALYFDLRPPYTLVDVAKKGEALDGSFLETALASHSSGVRVLAGPPDAQDMGMIGAVHVDRALRLLRSQFEWVLIDLPYGWDDLALRALNLVDEILLVSQVEVPALRHTNQQLELLESFGAPPDRVRVIMNRWNRRGAFSAGELSGLIGRGADFLLPEDCALVARCMNEGKLVTDAGRGSKLEQAFTQLAVLTRSWVRGEATASQSVSLTARLRGLLRGE